MTISKRLNNIILYMFELLSVVISFLTGIYIRHDTLVNLTTWRVQLYTSTLLALIMISLVSFLLRNHEDSQVMELDPIENMAVVLRHWTILLAVYTIYLFATQYAHRYSRLSFIYMACLGFFLEYVSRMVWRVYLIHTKVQYRIMKKVLLVTNSESAALAIRRIRMDTGSDVQVSCIAVLDRDMTGEEIEGIPVAGKEDNLTELRFSHEFQSVYLYLTGEPEHRIRKLVDELAEAGLSVDLSLQTFDTNITSGELVGRIGTQPTVHYATLTERCKILGINFAVSNAEAAVIYIRNHLKSLSGKYICFSNVHTTVMSQEDPDYLHVQNGAVFKFPDGTPIAWQQKRHGYPEARRVAGPDFMDAMFRSSMDGNVRHFFYGASEETISRLRENLPKKYPGISIAGLYSPPFREISPEEDEEHVRMINESGADIVWIGLGAPKQEKWMAAHEDRIHGVMVGVGAGFDFHAGTVKRAPVWIQRLGMEWFFRLCQDPKRLFNRYFVTNFKFVWYLAKNHLRRHKNARV